MVLLRLIKNKKNYSELKRVREHNTPPAQAEVHISVTKVAVQEDIISPPVLDLNTS